LQKTKLLSIIQLLISFCAEGQKEDYSVFQISNCKNRTWLTHKSNNQLLYKTIVDEALVLLKKREAGIAKLQTKNDWETYKKDLRAKVFSSLGRFKKTPLNPKITGVIKRDSYRIEKILFESHPGFYVTGCLFIPKKRHKPAPTVIYVSGHTALSFRSKTYQHLILNMVDKGFIVFAIDPIGQGERLQYPDGKPKKSKIGGPTTEHSFAGEQTLLTGISLSDYFIWDGVRAIDYLATRKEVDMERIGITGRSGGGTQTAMIAAYDERVYAAAPECYITNFKRLLQSIGPQDAEQNLYHAIKSGFDFPDYFHLRAPKPALIVTTTLDFFSQQGARETYAEALKSYSAMGKPHNISMVEDFGVHESTKKNREAVYAFFQKQLNLAGDSTDKETDIFSPKELWVTETGQVVTSLNSKTVFDLNQEYFTKTEVPKNRLKETVKKISGVNLNYKLTAAVFTGKLPKENYEINKYFLERENSDFVLPVWVVKAPDSKVDKIMLWLHPKGKEKTLESRMLTKFISAGYTVITADMPGTGELFDPGFTGDGFINKVPFNYTFGAQLSGISIPGILADNIDLLMQFAVDQRSENSQIDAFIEREMSSPFLHYVVFNNPFTRIVFLNPLTSNESLIHEQFYDTGLAYYVVPGSLPFYDFKDLVSLLPENSYKIIGQAGDVEQEVSSDVYEIETIDFFK
jgi:cephalosporin-C deacetylase-like acetyl esterase